MKRASEPPQDVHERQPSLPLAYGGGKAGPLTLPPHITTFEESRAWLLGISRDGAVCPCCDRPVVLHKRPLYGQLALALLLIHEQTAALASPDYVLVPSFLVTQGLPPRLAARIRGDYSKCQFQKFKQLRTQNAVVSTKVAATLHTISCNQFGGN